MNSPKVIFVLVILLLSVCTSISLVLAQSAYGPPIDGDGYQVSRSKVDRQISQGTIFRDSITISNTQGNNLEVTFTPSEQVSEVIEFIDNGIIVSPNNETSAFFYVVGKTLRNYSGSITLSGGVAETILVNISVVNVSLNPDFFINVETFQNRFTFKESFDYKIIVKKVTSEDTRNVSFSYQFLYQETNETFPLGSETKDVVGSFEIRKKIAFPEEMEEGYYTLIVTAENGKEIYTTQTEFLVQIPFWSRKLFGLIPLWLLAVLTGLAISAYIAYVFIKRYIERSKKYKMTLYLETLPKKGERTIWLGNVAETKHPAYYEMDAFTTHGVVAGATGGGKSISAQVIIEEMLLNNIGVIVFDPTAQWSGMLRKNEDKKMMSFYAKFGLKPNDAKAFKGNVRQIQNERQAIDISKYMTPGQIQIFTMNKLTPPQIDTFVASVIANIFRSDPKEFPGLRVMLVFDEVHRLLPKFGGSGKGFLQIERACREFRKWGFGVMLVSQVLSDFVGEIKANINTEVQMRTRDEADLNRIKTKYGEEFLQSLIKASVGVGMFVYPRYNKGKPYFINFRPILHSTRRLSDEVLEKYNKYGESIDDIEYQIEQLEAEKVDTFDLKMELKLVKDKLMTGNFTVVDIYLEGLKPRIEKQWQALGKQPKKKEIELVDTKAIESSLQAAQKGRDDFKKEDAPAPKQDDQGKQPPAQASGESSPPAK